METVADPVTLPDSGPPTQVEISPERVARMPPGALAVVISAVVFTVMVGLGIFIVAKYRAVQLHSLGQLGAVYVDKLLAPYALAQLENDPSAEALRSAISSVIGEGLPESSTVALRIWSPDQRLIYSSIRGDSATSHDPSDLLIALGGRSVTHLETSGPENSVSPIAFPFFENYVPIHDPRSGKLIAVGEIYQDAAAILEDRNLVEYTVWAAMGLATVGLLAMLSLSIRQSQQLSGRLASMRQLAVQNAQLRQEADAARLDAAQANEEVLNLVGAELHDGPVQILGLMSLMSGSGTSSVTALPDGTSFSSLTQDALAQLRVISSGLILPEVEDLDTHAIIDLAISRHRDLTGQDVEPDIGSLPTDLDRPRKVCLFRVIQEGLTNAGRHGNHMEPQLAVREEGNALLIILRNHDGRTSKDDAGKGLGLQGMRRRLAAFGGTCHFEHDGSEAVLTAVMPLPDVRGPGKRTVS